MILIHAPLTKGCEPPAALACLSAALAAHDLPCTTVDMNIEGLHYLLGQKTTATDTWTNRATRHVSDNIATLRTSAGYDNFDRYSRAVGDINRVLEMAGRDCNLRLSLANYQDDHLSPLKSGDLLQAAENCHSNFFYPYFSDRLDELCGQGSDTVIGFSLSYLSQALCTFAMIGYLRRNQPHKTIILGGGLVTTWLSSPDWQDPFTGLVDHLVAGQGEKPLLRLLGVEQRIGHVLPSYTTLAQNHYLAPGFILPYATSSGCFWKKCSFCPETSEKNPYRQVKPESAVKDLALLSQAMSPVLIHLLDNAVSPATLRALTERPPNSPWYGFVRIDRQLADPAFCRRLKDSGCVMLKLGLESGDQEVLNSMNKGINLAEASQVLHNLHAAGIASYVYLLFGTPAETERAAERTRVFIEDHHHAISFLNLAIFNLPICSEETASLPVTDFYSGDLSIYRNFEHPLGWNRGEVRRYLHATFRRSPRIGAILRKDPPVFTSNHAPFMKELR